MPVALRDDPAPPAESDTEPAGELRRRLVFLRRVPTVVWALLLLAIGLRIWMWIGYQPARMDLTDTVGYLWQLEVGVFHDPVHPAGYGIFLQAIREVTARLEVTIAIQHLLGLATGVLLYAAVRRFGCPIWTAVAAAAAVLLSPDQVFLEHALMSETLFALLLGLSLYACARAYASGRERVWRGLDARAAWLVAAGALLGLAACVRGVAVPLPAVLVLWAAVALGGAALIRVRNAALVGGAALLVLLGYATLNYLESEQFALGETSGWALYSRTAPFADCERFTPPDGTEDLCETTPVRSRPGPDFYGWESASPARRLFGGQPTGDDELGTFARRAILAQPLDYVETVGYDTLRFFVPHTPLVPDWFEDRTLSGLGYEITDIDARAPDFEQQVLEYTRTFYPSTTLSVTGAVDPLGEVQDVIRVHPALLLGSVILGLIGLAVSRGSARSGLVLFLAVGLLMLLISAATTTYTARYAVPAQGPLVAAGAIGLWQLASWLAGRRRLGRGVDDASLRA
jgi:hypothetical protein